MPKLDIKRTLAPLYSAKVGRFDIINVPPLNFFMIDGHGDPNVEPAYKAAIEALYTASYTLKFAVRGETGTDYSVPPLEGLWWADDPADFITRAKHRWSWTMMILVPDFVSREQAEAAIDAASEKKGLAALKELRFAPYHEGRCVQTLHVGSYDDEGPVLAEMHDRFIPESGLAMTGHHHEIYLSDARRVAPARLKTILRQPVMPA